MVDDKDTLEYNERIPEGWSSVHRLLGVVSLQPSPTDA